MLFSYNKKVNTIVCLAKRQCHSAHVFPVSEEMENGFQLFDMSFLSIYAFDFFHLCTNTIVVEFGSKAFIRKYITIHFCCSLREFLLPSCHFFLEKIVKKAKHM